jgi:hypothetical protein
MDGKNDDNQLRDRSELEGTFVALLTDVVAIPDDPYNAQNRLPMAVATVAPEQIAIPRIVVSYDDRDEKGNYDAIQDAVPFNAAYSTPNDDERERRITAWGTRRGQLQAEEEIEVIRRNNRDVHARNYFMEKQVKQANRKAAMRNFIEETGQTQTSSTIPILKNVPTPARKEPEFYPGTYGKEYETSEYDTMEYQTKDYEGSEYKSVYEP